MLRLKQTHFLLDTDFMDVCKESLRFLNSFCYELKQLGNKGFGNAEKRK